MLKEHEPGAKTADLCRKHGISEATFYNWKSKYGGMEVSEAKRLKALEDENARLKRLLADAMLDNAGAEGSAGKKMVTPAAKREAVAHLRERHEVSERRACRVIGCDRMTVRYHCAGGRRTAPARAAAWRWPGSAGGSATAACMILLRREGSS